jgi:hypothetical protein
MIEFLTLIPYKYKRRRQSKAKRRRKDETKIDSNSAGPDQYMGTYQSISVSDLKYGILKS